MASNGKQRKTLNLGRVRIPDSPPLFKFAEQI